MQQKSRNVAEKVSLDLTFNLYRTLLLISRLALIRISKVRDLPWHDCCHLICQVSKVCWQSRRVYNKYRQIPDLIFSTVRCRWNQPLFLQIKSLGEDWIFFLAFNHTNKRVVQSSVPNDRPRWGTNDCSLFCVLCRCQRVHFQFQSVMMVILVIAFSPFVSLFPTYWSLFH